MGKHTTNWSQRFWFQLGNNRLLLYKSWTTFPSQKHRHLEARKQMYKTVLEHEIKSTAISLQVLVAFLISLQRQKWQHPGAQSSSMGIATWSHWLLKLRLISWRHARVSCCSGTEWGFGQFYNNVWLDAQVVTPQPFSAQLCTSICSWCGCCCELEGAGPEGIWGLEGLPCQVLQWWEEAAGVAS